MDHPENVWVTVLDRLAAVEAKIADMEAAKPVIVAPEPVAEVKPNA